jgi:hypothetical protein
MIFDGAKDRPGTLSHENRSQYIPASTLFAVGLIALHEKLTELLDKRHPALEDHGETMNVLRSRVSWRLIEYVYAERNPREIAASQINGFGPRDDWSLDAVADMFHDLTEDVYTPPEAPCYITQLYDSQAWRHPDTANIEDREIWEQLKWEYPAVYTVLRMLGEGYKRREALEHVPRSTYYWQLNRLMEKYGLTKLDSLAA